jgi:hypothetical protein
MVGENGNANGGGTGSNGEGMPKLVEVEIDGKKVKVEESGKEYLLRQSDYTQKTQAVAEDRKKLESERAALQGELEAARAVLGYLNSDEEAAKVMDALAKGDKKAAKALLEGESGDEMSVLKREIENLKMQIKAKEVKDGDSAKRTAEYSEAKRRIQDEFKMSLDDWYPKMVERGTKDKNVFIPWFIATAREELEKQAEARGLDKGKNLAIEELSEKLLNTPMTSSGSGATSSGTDMRSVFKELLEEKAKRGLA